MRTASTRLTKLFDSSLTATEQRDALRDGAVPLAVYGLGKIGLPLAAVFADRTGAVVGVDIDPAVVDRINRGESHIDHEPELPELVADTVDAGALRATSDAVAAASTAAIHVIIVPTRLDGDRPDLGAIEAVLQSVAAGLDSGDLVILESTVPPGTCRDLVCPTLETESGLSRGDFGVAFCPERTASTRAVRDIRGSYPKIVGGVDAESTRAAALLYETVTTNVVVQVADATTAECVKVFEGVYRDVNIALANELAQLSDTLGIDARAAIEAANTQPFCDIHTPGIGVGGHCIPVYPHFIIGQYDVETPLLQSARTVNEAMPAYAVARLMDRLGESAADRSPVVLLLGVTYRPGIPETSHSPAYAVATALRECGADVLVTDPVIEARSGHEAIERLPGFSDLAVEAVPGDRVESTDPDGVILVTAHSEFDAIDWSAFDDLVILDGRGELDLARDDHTVLTIGGG